MFSSKDGRAQLGNSTQVGRLLVVHLNREHSYNNLDHIKEELSGYVMELAPHELPSNTQVPFLSLGRVTTCCDFNHKYQNMLNSSTKHIDNIVVPLDVDSNKENLLLPPMIFISCVKSSKKEILRGMILFKRVWQTQKVQSHP